MTPDFTPAIRRALTREVSFDLVALHLKKRMPQTGSTRTAWLRLDALRNTFNAGGNHNARTLSEIHKTCTKTIRRDVAALRKSGMEIKFNYQTNSYQVEVNRTSNHDLPWPPPLCELRSSVVQSSAK